MLWTDTGSLQTSKDKIEYSERIRGTLTAWRVVDEKRRTDKIRQDWDDTAYRGRKAVLISISAP